MKWKKIKNLPYDVCIILGFDADYTDDIHVLERDGDSWVISGTNEERTPTHWMPLPMPPSDV